MYQNSTPEHIHKWSYVGGIATALGVDETEKCTCGAIKETTGGYGCLEIKIIESPSKID